MQANHAPTPRIDPPTVVVHDAVTLRLAIDAARETAIASLRLLSAPDAGCFLGPAWWRALIAMTVPLLDRSRLALDDVLDCGDAAGRALEALRLGQRALVLEPSTQWLSVRERADLVGAILMRDRPDALDLGRPGAERHLTAWLRGAAADDRAGLPG